MNFENYYRQVKQGFTHEKKGDVVFLTIPSFVEADGLVHAFTTRKTGVSKDGFASLNFSFGREKNPKNIKANFEIIANTLGVLADDMVLDNYGHTPNVLNVTEEMRGAGVYNNAHLPTCDGLATVIKDLPLVTMHADCAAIFLYDPKKSAVCVCHAGWRGTAGGIVKNAVDMMTDKFGCRIEDILAGIGPCIQSCCFEIKSDVEKEFKDAFGDFSVEYREGKIFGDLEKGIVSCFMRAGIAPQNVTRSGECTFCDEENYYSYRRQGQNGGAMASVVMLKK
ncbi:MAG: peptidoglycan editing factor PgeF [Eubacteriales bacterium]